MGREYLFPQDEAMIKKAIVDEICERYLGDEGYLRELIMDGEHGLDHMDTEDLLDRFDSIVEGTTENKLGVTTYTEGEIIRTYDYALEDFVATTVKRNHDTRELGVRDLEELKESYTNRIKKDISKLSLYEVMNEINWLHSIK